MKTKDIAAKYDLKQFEIEDFLMIHSASYATKDHFKQVEDSDVDRLVADIKLDKDEKQRLAAEKEALENAAENEKNAILEQKRLAEEKIFKDQVERLNAKVESIREEERIEEEKLIIELKGCRGRSIKIYPEKCVISVEPTLGSIITGNSTDGEKTIYYKDVNGFQYKTCGWTIGYIQLETASGLMNNGSSNFFNENTFTFEADSEVIDNAVLYLKNRIRHCKFD